MMSALVHLIVGDHDQTLLVVSVICNCCTIDILDLLPCLTIFFLFRLVASGVIFCPDVVAGGCSGKHTSFGAIGGMSYASDLG